MVDAPTAGRLPAVLFARVVARELGVDVPVGKQGIREFLAIKVPPGLDPLYRW